MTKILVWSGLIIIILILVYYFLLPKLLSYKLSNKPGNPKIQIAETHSIGWWSNQEALNVDTFEVEIVESKLNLLNSKSLIKYHIKGHLTYKKGWRPFIKEIHLSERFLTHSNDSINNPDALAMIEITPIIGTKDDKNYNGEEIEFAITNEKIIHSFHWGNNQLRFKCMEETKDIVLTQRK